MLVAKADFVNFKSGERAETKSNAVAHAGAPVDGRNERQKGFNVDLSEESVGLERVTISCLLGRFFPNLLQATFWARFNHVS